MVAEWGVIPSIRVRDMAEAVAFYRDTLEFTLDSGGDDANNSSLTRGDAHVMIETAADLYGDQYNAAIRARLGRPSSIDLYMEASDLPAFYSRLEAAGARIVDPLATRRGVRSSHHRGSRGQLADLLAEDRWSLTSPSRSPEWRGVVELEKAVGD